MKYAIAALMTLTSFSAFATTLHCTDVAAGPDHGFYVDISNGMKSANITSQSIMGPRPVANLTCTRLPKPGSTYPDQLVPFLSCSEPQIADAGYSLVVSSGGFMGGLSAELSEVTFAGAKPVTSLTCVQQ